MSQLIRIILIDSLCAGAKAELAMDSNTSVTGTNGIGKSSFMKLIPVFYGAAPGRLVKASSNRESFANWYLPNLSSFIVFEYTNYMSAARCAVMHRSGEGYAYRLINAAWRPELLYRDYEAGELVLPGELNRHLAAQGAQCSPELQPIHYRRIIQFNSGTAHLEDVKDTARRKMITALRPQYSLAPRRKDFNGIDNVTLALLESGGTFDTMKATMAEILQQENADPSRTLLMLNAQLFKNVIDNRAGYLLMDALKSTIQQMNQVRLEVHAVVRQLCLQKRKAMLLEDHLKKREMKRDEALAALSLEQTALGEASLGKRSTLVHKRMDLEASLKTEHEWISKVETQRDEHAEKRMATLSERLDRLPAMQSQRDLKQNHLDQLSRNGLDIRRVYEQSTKLAEEAAYAQRETTREQSEASIFLLQLRKEEFDARQTALYDQAREQQSSEMDKQQVQLNAALTQRVKEMNTLTHLQSSAVLPTDQALLNQARQEIDEQLGIFKEHQSGIGSLEDAEQALHTEQAKLAAEFQGIQNQIEVLQDSREELKIQLNASAETFLGFLRRHHPDWSSNIARLVPADILMRTDLNPALLNVTQNSLYGVELSLNVLPAATIASVSEIESEIASLSSRIDSLNNELESVRRRTRNLEERVRIQSATLTLARNDERHAHAELLSRRSVFEGLQSRALENHSLQIELQTQLVQEANERFDVMNERLDALKDEHKRYLRDLTSASEQAKHNLKLEISSVQVARDASLARISETLTAQLREINDELIALLHDAGIDDRVNQRLAAEIETLKLEIKDVEALRSKIESYRHWASNIYPQLAQRIERKNLLQGDLDRQNRLINEHDLETKEAQGVLSSRRSKLVKEGGEDADQQRTLRNILHPLAPYEPAETVAWNPNLNAADIEVEVNGLIRRRNDFQRQGSNLYRVVRARFREDSLLHTPQGAAIEQIVAQASNSAHEPEFAWLDAAPHLYEYIEVSHPDQKLKLIIQAKNLSDELCDSRAKLQQLHKSIQKLGRDATEKAGEVLGAFEQIRQFEFKVTSRIHSLTFWDDLSNYETQYRRWTAVNDTQLPSDAFMDALRSIARQITEGAFSSNLSDCFDVSVSCNDQGRLKVATNNADLIGMSSTGLTKIIVAMIYVSLFELLRQDADFRMSIPIDEALELSAENYVALVNYFNERGLSMLACFPGGAPELLRQFANRYTLERRADTGAIIVKEYAEEGDDELDDLNEALAPDQAEFAL
ncbi:ATP-binding protein [Pseudomonas moraviensis]